MLTLALKVFISYLKKYSNIILILIENYVYLFDFAATFKHNVKKIV